MLSVTVKHRYLIDKVVETSFLLSGRKILLTENYKRVSAVDNHADRRSLPVEKLGYGGRSHHEQGRSFEWLPELAMKQRLLKLFDDRGSPGSKAPIQAFADEYLHMTNGRSIIPTLLFGMLFSCFTCICPIHYCYCQCPHWDWQRQLYYG